jgi:uncharacterized CHY-type Zn-finger protein
MSHDQDFDPRSGEPRQVEGPYLLCGACREPIPLIVELFDGTRCPWCRRPVKGGEAT